VERDHDGLAPDQDHERPRPPPQLLDPLGDQHGQEGHGHVRDAEESHPGVVGIFRLTEQADQEEARDHHQGQPADAQHQGLDVQRAPEQLHGLPV
jgi:hypothetical protein